jgi:3-hydroxyisobutyrate dehydrogenase/glyoxylate/succinic semialdehyde reductase
MGRDVVHVGGPGMGAALKMVFNMLIGISMQGFAEALHLGEALGIDRERLLDTLPGTPTVAPFIQGKVAKLKAEEFSPEFPLQWMQKDLHLAALSAYEVGVPMPVENAAKEAFARALHDGLSDLDFSAVARTLPGANHTE